MSKRGGWNGNEASRDERRAPLKDADVPKGEAMSTRLDEIEARWLEGDICDEVPALVAVARAAARLKRVWLAMAKTKGAEWEKLQEERISAELDLEDALAPLLAEKGE